MDIAAKQQEEKKISKGIDIAFIIIGLAMLFGLGALFGSGVWKHLTYLTAKDKITVTGKYAGAVRKETGVKVKQYEDGTWEYADLYDVTYEYEVDGQTCTFTRRDVSTFTKDDVPLRLYRTGSGEYQQTDMYGAWAGMQWVLLALSVYLGLKAIRFGVRSLKQDKQKESVTDT
jgi:hypothetical protein